MSNPVTKSPNTHPNPSPSEYSEDWDEAVIQPLRSVRDHLHWLSVIRHKRTAGWFEMLVESILHMAYDYRGQLSRGDE